MNSRHRTSSRRGMSPKRRIDRRHKCGAKGRRVALSSHVEGRR